MDWFVGDAAAEEYRHLTWEQELAEAKERDGKEPTAEVRL